MILLKRLRVENFKLLRQLDLAFPSQGSVLVEGLNESGKSTLFESVFYALYGTPLIAEGKGRGNLESVIHYGADAATVELLLQVGDTELEIRRSVGRGKPTQATLVVRPLGSPEERVSGVLAVNARVVEELGGLDGEALLNSCFVEQKKLSKLEDLAGGQRKDSLRKLLNLERLTDLADKFRVTLQDERSLAEARDRLEMAELAAQLPRVASERADLEAALRGSPPAENPPLSEGGDRAWAKTAGDLDRVRRSQLAARRRGTAILGAGALLLLLAAGLFASGLQAALWSLLLVAALMLAAMVSFRSAGALSTSAAHLESEMALQRDSLVAKMGELEGRHRRLGERLGDSEDSNLEECRFHLQTLGRQMEVKRRAALLVEGAMERIVRMVLPNTERNLAQILPLLTAGRYHEARIAEDYQIQVWDDAAGRYVSKSVFSGGAKDQFSLALRLAFALATLPQELGATPGFLFLDEPLSSFDGPRTEALVQLLTSGQVGESFNQIFVISHNRSFDLSAFQYRLVMRDGRVVESNLPSAAL